MKARHLIPFSNQIVFSSRGADAFQLFLVFGAGTVIVVRLYLELTGFPQVGGAGLHVAHVLWGGLFMGLAVAFSVTFTGPGVIKLAAPLGGIGFGLFIDELGKFVTEDNDYFFQPTLGLIYGVFVAFFVGFSWLASRVAQAEVSNLANALDLIRDGTIAGLSDADLRELNGLLAHADQTHPLVAPLSAYTRRELFRHAPVDRLMLLQDRLSALYRRASSQYLFNPVVVGVFVTQALVTLGQTFWAIGSAQTAVVWAALALFLPLALAGRRISIGPRKLSVGLLALVAGGVVVTWAAAATVEERLSFQEWAPVLSASVSGGLVGVGLLQIWWSRLKAYESFRGALLISLLFTQFFVFFRDELSGLIGFGLLFAAYLALGYLIRQERAAGG